MKKSICKPSRKGEGRQVVWAARRPWAPRMGGSQYIHSGERLLAAVVDTPF